MFSASPHRIFLLATMLMLTPLSRGQETSLVGSTRAAVAQQLGEPQSVLRRGEREILVFAGGERVELIGDEVVAHRSQTGGVVISRDGTRYRTNADGRLAPERAASTAPVPTEAQEAIAEPEGVASTDAETVSDPAHSDTEGAQLPEEARELPGVADLDPEKMMEEFGLEEPEPPPPWVEAAASLAGMTVRFVIMIIVLQIALKWVGQPYYLGDILKIGALYVIIRDGLHAVGGLGGMWEIVSLFRIDDIVAFFALAVLIFKCDIVRNGVSALKIAFATKMVTYGLMIAAGLAITFGLAMVY